MTDESIKEMWYTQWSFICPMKNKIILFAGKWIVLENFMLSEVSQAQKVKGCKFSLMCGI
jgi:hypothetical protein